MSQYGNSFISQLVRIPVDEVKLAVNSRSRPVLLQSIAIGSIREKYLATL